MIEFLDWTTLAIFAIVLLLSIKFFTGPKNLPPGPPVWPVVGNLSLILKNQKKLPEFFGELKGTYGPIISFSSFGAVIVVISDFDVIKEVFVKKSEYYGFRPVGFNVTKILFGNNNGVIASNGHLWLKTRRFTLQNLRDMGMGKNTIESTIQDEISCLQQELASYGGKPTNIRGLLLHAVSNIICSVIFGKRTAYSDDDFRSMVSNLNISLNSISFIHPANIIPGCLEYFAVGRFVVRVFGKLEKFTDEQIQQHAESFDPNETRDFTDIYLQCEKEASGDENDHLTRDNLKGIIRDLFLAGTDTTSTTLYWTMLYMIAFPEIQNKCKDEIIKVIGDSKMVRYSDRKELHYVQATLAEIQRLATIVPLGVPHRADADTVLNGFTIPKNTVIFANLLKVHHDKNIWGDDADIMRPERWLDEEGKFVKNEKLIPFSIGSRVCLGEQLAKMEIFMIFVGFLQQLTFTKESPDLEVDLTGVSGAIRSPNDYSICAKV